MTNPPEHNVTGIDYSDRRHLAYTGPIIDLHAHVMITRPDDPPNMPPKGTGPGASISQAEMMLEVGAEFGVTQFRGLARMCRSRSCSRSPPKNKGSTSPASTLFP